MADTAQDTQVTPLVREKLRSSAVRYLPPKLLKSVRHCLITIDRARRSS